jgi:hypothetical protein
MKTHLAWKSALFCALGGLCFTASAMGGGHFAAWWVAGVLIAASLLPIVVRGPQSMGAQFGSIAAVLVIIGLVCTMSEGVLFFPETKKMLIPAFFGGSVLYIIIAALLVLLARGLRLTTPPAETVHHRPFPVAIPMLLLSGFSYVLYYLVFGAIAFQGFTKKFYPNAVEQVMAIGNWFWAYQWGRGILMTLAVLPVVYTLRLPRWKAALAIGAMVWIVGGGASLLVPGTLMVPAQRYAHILEIMTQNVPLGITAVLLLRPKSTKVAEPLTHPVTV